VVALEALLAAPASTFAGAVLYEPPIVIGAPLGGDAVARARVALAAGKAGIALTIFLRDVVELPPGAASLAGHLAVGLPRWRAMVPRQIDDTAAINQLGNRLDAYSRIGAPALLLGGARSPTHLGERLRTLAGVMPHAELTILPRQGHGANTQAPGKVAAVVSAFADTVLR
jgi:pimeloyl-ACP methyl ester carboxylesterase